MCKIEIERKGGRVMRCDVIIDKECEERVQIYAKERGALVEEIERLCSTDSRELVGYSDGSIVPLDIAEVYAFVADEGGAVAITESERLAVKMRLYELADMLGDRFLKINQSVMVNVKKIARFEAHISGSMAVILKNGYRDFVSRRQLKFVKERIGF